MKIFLRAFLVFSLLFFSLFVHSQTKVDTINLVLGLKDLGLYKQMYTVLSEYRVAHPDDVNVEWLYGQAAFYCGRKKEMSAVYEKNISLHQSNYYLQLDYAFKTTESGNLKKGKKMLEQHLLGDPENPKINEYLAKIDYWQSNYNAALLKLEKARKVLPNDAGIAALYSEIKIAKAPWIEVSYSHFQDKQPISYMTPNLSAGKYINRFLMPSVSVNTQVIDTGSNNAQTFWIRANNTSMFSKAGVSLRTGLGMFVFPNSKNELTWLAGIDKSLFNQFKLTVQAERKPYMLLKSSFDEDVMYIDFATKLYWEKPNSFMGQLAYNASLFEDGNRVETVSAWLVSPPLKIWKIALHAGYGFGYTNSKKDSYSQVKTDEELFYQIDTNTNVAGSFKSYVTPIEQKVHSVIGVLSFKPFRFLQLSVSGSYGFNASIRTPFLYGYYSADSEVVVESGYYTQEFAPFEIGAKATVTLSKLLDLRIQYSHGYPDFYNETDYLEVMLKIKLIHGQK